MTAKEDPSKISTLALRALIAAVEQELDLRERLGDLAPRPEAPSCLGQWTMLELRKWLDTADTVLEQRNYHPEVDWG